MITSRRLEAVIVELSQQAMPCTKDMGALCTALNGAATLVTYGLLRIAEAIEGANKRSEPDLRST